MLKTIQKYLLLCFYLALLIFTVSMILQGFYLVIQLLPYAAVYMLSGGSDVGRLIL